MIEKTAHELVATKPPADNAPAPLPPPQATTGEERDGTIHLSIDEAMNVAGYLETIIAETEDAEPETETIHEQAHAALNIIHRELVRPIAPPATPGAAGEKCGWCSNPAGLHFRMDGFQWHACLAHRQEYDNTIRRHVAYHTSTPPAEVQPAAAAASGEAGELAAIVLLIDQYELHRRPETRPTLAPYPKGGVEYVGVVTAELPEVKRARKAVDVIAAALDEVESLRRENERIAKLAHAWERYARDDQAEHETEAAIAERDAARAEADALRERLDECEADREKILASIGQRARAALARHGERQQPGQPGGSIAGEA